MAAATVQLPTGTSVIAGWKGCPNHTPWSAFLTRLPRSPAASKTSLINSDATIHSRLQPILLFDRC